MDEWWKLKVFLLTTACWARFKTQNNLKVHKSTLAGETSSWKWSRARKSIRIWFIQMKHRLKVHFAGDLWRCGSQGSFNESVCLFLFPLRLESLTDKSFDPLGVLASPPRETFAKTKTEERTCFCYWFHERQQLSLRAFAEELFREGHSVLSSSKQCSDSLNLALWAKQSGESWKDSRIKDEEILYTRR